MFHPRCGRCVHLANGNKTAFRSNPTQEFNRGLIFSLEPIKDNEVFEVTIDKKFFRPLSLRPLVTPASQRFNPSHGGLPELSVRVCMFEPMKYSVHYSRRYSVMGVTSGNTEFVPLVLVRRITAVWCVGNLVTNSGTV
ncbi:Neuralized-like protein 4 [Chionoecetes opilio]|uniref:Neuralized-like protein 4 n=1 Tax=Chionoecetes opilio TaxID=41210 RepID=A0A8J4YW78_CHIOP|nr:Neuralized-like protein 4 [Chionoecetes opilio]